jgi:hypothetical protein
MGHYVRMKTILLFQLFDVNETWLWGLASPR